MAGGTSPPLRPTSTLAGHWWRKVSHCAICPGSEGWSEGGRKHLLSDICIKTVKIECGREWQDDVPGQRKKFKTDCQTRNSIWSEWARRLGSQNDPRVFYQSTKCGPSSTSPPRRQGQSITQMNPLLLSSTLRKRVAGFEKLILQEIYKRPGKKFEYHSREKICYPWHCWLNNYLSQKPTQLHNYHFVIQTYREICRVYTNPKKFLARGGVSRLAQFDLVRSGLAQISFAWCSACFTVLCHARQDHII